MPLLGSVDVEFLALGVQGSFDETAIGNSGLSRLGTGRILDQLASLLERNLIEADGPCFRITPKARSYLWDERTPLWARILRLLEITPLPAADICRYLDKDADGVASGLEDLRRGGLVIMYPVKKGDGLARVYQATEDGVRRLERPLDDTVPPVSAEKLISEIIRDVASLNADKPKKDAIVSRLETLRDVL